MGESRYSASREWREKREKKKKKKNYVKKSQDHVSAEGEETKDEKGSGERRVPEKAEDGKGTKKKPPHDLENEGLGRTGRRG